MDHLNELIVEFAVNCNKDYRQTDQQTIDNQFNSVKLLVLPVI
ncbi:hypothetical protein BAP_3688 [Bacillus sp. CN2]|nr:hypothetical protein BAP_3688 [Bacillus sp. CN2]